MRLLLLAALLITALAESAAATEHGQVFDLGDKAPVPGNKLWRDLLARLFPDLRQEPWKDGRTADFIHGKVDIRAVDKESFEDDCPDEPLRIEYLDYADVQIDNKSYLIVSITTDLDACFGALALFSGEGDAKLLDAVNIQQDANYVFGGNFARSLGAGAQLVVADSFHTTTSSSPDNYVLVLATADKLSLIGNVDGRSEWDCDHHRSIGEEPYVAIAPDYGAYDRITGYIKRIVQPLGQDCRTHTGNPKITITHTDWRWDAAKKAYRRASP